MPGIKTAETLATALHTSHRVLLVEKNSHFQVSAAKAAVPDHRKLTRSQHLFAFPRFAVTSTGFDTRKAFIPFRPGAFSQCPPDSGKVVQARVTDISRTSIKLDRKVELDGAQVQELPYQYLVSPVPTFGSAASADTSHAGHCDCRQASWSSI